MSFSIDPNPPTHVYKNSGNILFEVSSEHSNCFYKQFTIHLYGELLNFFYLYNTRVSDPLPLFIFTL